jgi:hypothetical protein
MAISKNSNILLSVAWVLTFMPHEKYFVVLLIEYAEQVMNNDKASA